MSFKKAVPYEPIPETISWDARNTDNHTRGSAAWRRGDPITTNKMPEAKSDQPQFCRGE